MPMSIRRVTAPGASFVQAFSKIVAINNAWRVRPDWDFLVHAGDFPPDRMPEGEALRQAQIFSAEHYVPAQNTFGGFVYAGGTMSMTAAYWTIHSQKPDVLAFLEVLESLAPQIKATGVDPLARQI